MRHLIPTDRTVLDETGAPVTRRNKVNFTGGRVSPIVNAGVATITVADGGGSLSPSTQAIFGTPSLTSSDTKLDLGAVYSGVWRSFINQGFSNLAQGKVNFDEAGLYHISLYSQVTSGANYPFANWPWINVYRSNVGSGVLGTYAENPGGATPAKAGCSLNYTDFFEINDEAYFQVSMPAGWTTRSLSNAVYITKIL